MKAPKSSTCANCRWAEFERTDKGNIKRKQHGTCTWPALVVPALPLCMERPTFYRRGIWPNYQDCPVWEAQPEVGPALSNTNLAHDPE
jgi:hypothetical protein